MMEYPGSYFDTKCLMEGRQTKVLSIVKQETLYVAYPVHVLPKSVALNTIDKRKRELGTTACLS